MENGLRAADLTFRVFCRGLLCEIKSSLLSDRMPHAPRPPLPPRCQSKGMPVGSLPVGVWALCVTQKPPSVPSAAKVRRKHVVPGIASSI